MQGLCAKKHDTDVMPSECRRFPEGAVIDSGCFSCFSGIYLSLIFLGQELATLDIWQLTVDLTKGIIECGNNRKLTYIGNVFKLLVKPLN